MKCNYLYGSNISHPALVKAKQPNFTGNNIIPEALTHVNIGSKPNGFIGKIKVRLAQGGEAVLNVFKRLEGPSKEHYTIKNDYDELIGEADVIIKKYSTYDKWSYKTDPSHVFIDNLRNYTKPDTPYYNGLTYHKDIGTRLLQIAQRRSDEAQCFGNIKLISKNESKDWYLNYIKMQTEFPPNSYGFSIHNPNQLYLPPESKEALSKLQGGL